MRAALKMLALLAVLLMPFGMAPAAASGHSRAAAAMPMQHCPEQDSKHDSKGAFAACTMACASALPVGEIVRRNPLLTASHPTEPTVAHSLHGLHPETATPPPKAS